QEAFGEGDDDVAAAPLAGVDAGQDADAGPPVAAGAGADAQGQAAPPLPGALGQLDELGDRVDGWPGRGDGAPGDRGHVEVAVGAGRGLLAEVDGGPGTGGPALDDGGRPGGLLLDGLDVVAGGAQAGELAGVAVGVHLPAAVGAGAQGGQDDGDGVDPHQVGHGGAVGADDDHPLLRHVDLVSAR